MEIDLLTRGLYIGYQSLSQVSFFLPLSKLKSQGRSCVVRPTFLEQLDRELLIYQRT